VRKSGAWYTYDGDQLGQGKDNSRKFLLENPEIAAEIEGKIMLKLGIGAEGKAAKDIADKAAAVARSEANAAKLAAAAEKTAKAAGAAALKVSKADAAAAPKGAAARAGAQSVAERADAELLKAVGE